MKKVFILLLFILISSMIYSQSTKPRVGVLDFTANNISLSEAITIGEMFTSELVLSGKYDVVDRKNIESLMAEMEFQMSGCTDSSCAVEVGQILALDYMMYGSINKLGESFVINVYMINVETAQIEGTSRERFNTIEQSYDVMSAVIGKLIEGGNYKPVTQDETQTIETKEVISSAPSRKRFIFEIDAGILLYDMEEIWPSGHLGFSFYLTENFALGLFGGFPAVGAQIYLTTVNNISLALRAGLSFADFTPFVGGKFYIKNTYISVGYSFPDEGYPGEIYTLIGYAFHF